MMNSVFRLDSFEPITDLKAMKLIGLVPSESVENKLKQQKLIRQILFDNYSTNLSSEVFNLSEGLTKKVLIKG